MFNFIKIDTRLPELILLLVKVAHPDFSKVPRMVLVQIRAVMVLTSRHTATSGIYIKK